MWVPDRYQLRARNFLRTRLEAGLLLPPGFGKTSIVLSAIKELRRKRKINRVLVVAPIRPAYHVWPAEIPLWAQFEHYTFSILHGKDKEDRLNDDVDIHIINYDGLPWLAKTGFKKSKWDLIVLDESSYIKHTTTNRFRALRFIRKKIPHCWILNGSPISRAYEDLFGQLLAMDNGKTFGTRIKPFREKYFRKTGWGNYKHEVTRKGKRLIKEKITPSAFSLAEGDHFKLPPLITKDVWVEFPPKVRQQYNHFLKESIMRLPGGQRAIAVNAGVLTSKALQFTGGNIYYEDKTTGAKKAHHIHGLKEEALIELLEELHGNPALIGYRFKHELARLEQVLRPYQDPVPVMRDASDVAMIRDWNLGKLSIMLGYPQVMSHGLNLQKFPEGHGAVIFYTPIHDYSQYDQMIRRIRRRGFNRHVIVYRILVRDSVDEAVIEALKAKEKNQSDFLNHIVNYWVRFADDI